MRVGRFIYICVILLTLGSCADRADREVDHDVVDKSSVYRAEVCAAMASTDPLPAMTLVERMARDGVKCSGSKATGDDDPPDKPTVKEEEGSIPPPLPLCLTSVQLDWHPAARAEWYNILISETGEEGSYTPVPGTFTSTSTPIGGLQTGRRYYFKIRAHNTFGVSAYSVAKPRTTCWEGEPTQQSCPLWNGPGGWNLVSWAVETESTDIETVLAPIMDCVVVVLGWDNEGQRYTTHPEKQEFSTLAEVNHLSGYWIKLKPECSDVTLTIEGTTLPPSTTIDLLQGWNLVSYLPETTLPVQDALISIEDTLEIAMGFDQGGLAYVPGEDVYNTLINMSPCFGYWIKASQPDALQYPLDSPISPAPPAGGSVTVTNLWMDLYSANLTLDGNVVLAGSEVIAHRSSDDQIVGSFTLVQDGLFGYMAVYGDDPFTAGVIEGVESGGTFYLSVNGQITGPAFSFQDQTELEVAPLVTP